jgi:hypothetical protein
MVEEVAMPKAKQITVWTEDLPGRLGRVATTLGEKKVNILAFWAGVVRDRWAIRMIVDKPEVAKKHLREQRCEITEEHVVVVTLGDKPGSLGRVASKLGAARINIDYAYTSRARGAGKINTYFGVVNMEAALKELR